MCGHSKRENRAAIGGFNPAVPVLLVSAGNLFGDN